jgi:hypothetical protein
MATRWNDIKLQRASRSSQLSGVPAPTPPLFTDLGGVSKIEVNGVTSSPSFLIPGVVPQRVDIFSAVLEEEPVERWLARPRGVTFPVRYENIDVNGLDSEFVVDVGLTAANDGTGSWVGYFPTMQSDTQVYTETNNKPATWDDELVVGGFTTFNTTESLDGTAYTVGRIIYGREENLQGSPSWSGVIALREDPNTMEVTITSVSSPESINMDSTTQHWYISNDANLLDNLF